MWTPELTRARYVEAAFTERYLPAARGPSGKGYWPEFFHDQEDEAGWDDAAKLDNAAKWKGRASNGAISRHLECLDWTAKFIDPKRSLTIPMAQVLWAWAFCRANGWDFGGKCVKRGWARPTAYRRLTAAVEQITDNLNNVRALLREPDARWVRQEEPSSIQRSGWLQSCDTSQAIKFSPGYQTEKSRDLLTSPEAIADFVKHRDMVNAERRGLQEREAKRRAKIGAMAS
jgi:hypothetical protein